MKLLGPILAGLLGFLPICLGQEAPKPATSAEDPALIRKLEAIDQKAAAAADLTAEFEQKKFTAMLKQPMASSGTLKVKGTAVRWDTLKPEPSVMRIDERELRIYYPNQKVIEVYPIGDEVRRLTASPLPRLAAIRAEFFIAQVNPRELDPAADPERTVGLKLTPRGERLKEHVLSVTVLLDASTGSATRVEVTDPDGDRTVLAFSRVKVNTGVRESDLELKAPEGVKVVNPLSGTSPPAGSKP